MGRPYIIFKLINQKINFLLKGESAFVLDGFPQSFNQYQYLLDLLKKDKKIEKICFLEFTIENDKAIERMASRLSCPICHYIYKAFPFY